MVFRGPTEILAVEIERLMLDWQAQYRRLSVKRAWLAEHTWLPVRLVIVIEDTRRNRAAVAPHRPLIQSVIPIGSRGVLSAIRSGTPLGGDGLCWLRRSSEASLAARRPDRSRASSHEIGTGEPLPDG